MTAPTPNGTGPGGVGAPDETLPRTLRARLALRVLRRLGADPGAPADVSLGRKPRTWQNFLWDLGPDEIAPRADGFIVPPWEVPEWITRLPEQDLPVALEAQKRVTQARHDLLAATEEKASRLLTPFVALLAGAMTLTAFQVAAVDFERPFPACLAVAGTAFGIAGSLWVLVGMVRALDADTRMSRSAGATVEQEVRAPRMALANEARGARDAAFSQQMKAERILFARAAISRGLLMLLISAFFGAGVLLVSDEVVESQAPDPGPSPTVEVDPTSGPASPITSPRVSPTPSATPSPTPGPRPATPNSTSGSIPESGF